MSDRGDKQPDAPAAGRQPVSDAAKRALAEAAARRAEAEAAPLPPVETAGRGGLEPARYGDWEIKGIACDF